MSGSWEAYSSQLLKDLLYNQRITYVELARKFHDRGYFVDARVLANKINRGTFSSSFFWSCIAVMGLTIDSIPWSILAEQNPPPTRHGLERRRGEAKPVAPVPDLSREKMLKLGLESQSQTDSDLTLSNREPD